MCIAAGVAGSWQTSLLDNNRWSGCLEVAKEEWAASVQTMSAHDRQIAEDSRFFLSASVLVTVVQLFFADN